MTTLMTAQKDLMTVSTSTVTIADRYLQSLAPAGRQGVVVALNRIADIAGYTVSTMPWSSVRAPQAACWPTA